MLTKQKIEQFYRDVNGMDLKFPVAAIADATGESKGNVSKYLNKKIEPSEAFLNKFYEKFSSKKVSDGNGSTGNKTDGVTDYRDEVIQLLKEKAKFNLAEQQQELKAIAGMQAAIIELLLLLASEKKSVYNKSVEILEKYSLKGSFV